MASFDLWRYRSPLDLRPYESRPLSQVDISLLVTLMHTTPDANESIESLLAKTDQSVVASCLEEIARNGDPESKCNAVDMMARLRLPSAIRGVDILLSDQDVDVRCAGCRILPMIDNQDSVSRLLRCMQTDPSELVRYIAVDGIGIIGNASAIPILQSVAESDSGCDYEGRPIRDKAIKVIERLSKINKETL